jgi:hypothetical protein
MIGNGRIIPSLLLNFYKGIEMIQKLKDNNQDFEWYPTTEEMIDCIHEHMLKNCYIDNSFYIHLLKVNSIMDIGAGDGRVLLGLESRLNKITNTQEETYRKYAIEKSSILCQSLIQNNIFILGTDFNEQANLIDKPVDLIFCNPPYKVFVEWTIKILKESNTSNIYLIIPNRWKENEKIKDLIDRKDYKFEVLGSYSFLDAERQARSKVDIIYFNKKYSVDPFFDWFSENFNININNNSVSFDEKKKVVTKELMSKENLVKELVLSYKAKMQSLLKSYKNIENIDGSILGELEVSVSGIMEGLKTKIKGLKSLYWKILFENLTTLTDRLTYKCLEKIQEKLTSHSYVDFTYDNIYVIVIWVINNANKYYNDQMIDLFFEFIREKNIIPYKSNHRFNFDDWRYNKKEINKVTLDYRIVDYFYGAIKIEGSYYGFDYEKGLRREAHKRLHDLIIVANNLGFNVISSSYDFEWEAGKQNIFYLDDGTIFANIRAFKNGNLHYKFNIKFMKKFNVEVSRLLKWVRTPKEASEEFDVTFKEACEFFETNIQISKSMLKLIG